MTARYILEDVSLVENDFSVDSRNKDGVRVVSYDARRSIKVHLAIASITQIEVVMDAKGEEGRSIVTLATGQRYVTRRSAEDVCDSIEKAGAP